jgi:YD repeat-containing protein
VCNGPPIWRRRLGAADGEAVRDGIDAAATRTAKGFVRKDSRPLCLNPTPLSQSRSDALHRLERYRYDPAGNLAEFTDRKEQVTQLDYDARNRRTQATYADATTSFTYDAVGRLIKASDTAAGAGTIEFAYDVLDRLKQETTPLGTVVYQYDVLGRRTQMTANGQTPTTYHYDAASRLTRVEQGALFAALGYDDAGRRTSLGYSNGTTTEEIKGVGSLFLTPS